MEIIALKDKDWNFGLRASPVLQTAKLLQRISYAIKRPFYSGADTVDACDNKDGKEPGD